MVIRLKSGGYLLSWYDGPKSRVEGPPTTTKRLGPIHQGVELSVGAHPTSFALFCTHALLA